jgi:thymidylate synthase
MFTYIKITYLKHVNRITREPFRLPKLEINDQYWVIDCDLDTHILSMLIEDFQVKKYQSHPTIKVQLSN